MKMFKFKVELCLKNSNKNILYNLDLPLEYINFNTCDVWFKAAKQISRSIDTLFKSIQSARLTIYASGRLVCDIKKETCSNFFAPFAVHDLAPVYGSFDKLGKAMRSALEAELRVQLTK